MDGCSTAIHNCGEIRMYGREKLETYITFERNENSEELKVGEVFLKAEADKVMDVMENHIKKLEAENEKLKADLKIARIIFDE